MLTKLETEHSPVANLDLHPLFEHSTFITLVRNPSNLESTFSRTTSFDASFIRPYHPSAFPFFSGTVLSLNFLRSAIVSTKTTSIVRAKATEKAVPKPESVRVITGRKNNFPNEEQ